MSSNPLPKHKKRKSTIKQTRTRSKLARINKNIPTLNVGISIPSPIYHIDALHPQRLSKNT